MSLLTIIGRVTIGWLFVHAGWHVLREPGMGAAAAAPTLARLRERIPALPADDATVVRGNAALHLVAGSMLIAGRVPRLAALALAASLVPTTMAGHSFWTMSDPALRAQHKSHFNKNLAIFGGLLLGACAPGRPGAPAGHGEG